MKPTKTVKHQSYFFVNRFIIDGISYPIYWDTRNYWAWYYDRQLYIAQSNSSAYFFTNSRDTFAHVLHGDFSNRYPKLPKKDFPYLLAGEKTLLCSSKAEVKSQEWTLYDGTIVRASDVLFKEWYIDDTVVMRIANSKMFSTTWDIEMFTEESLLPALLCIYILTGKNVSG